MMWFGFLVLYDLLGMQQATRVCHVLPDNSVNSSCPFQTCATLSEYRGNDFMFTESDIEYHFLPGEYQVSTEMIIAFVENVSFHGIVGDSLPPVVLKFHPSLSQPIVIVTCKNVTISNIIF